MLSYSILMCLIFAIDEFFLKALSVYGSLIACVYFIEAGKRFVEFNENSMNFFS